MANPAAPVSENKPGNEATPSGDLNAPAPKAKKSPLAFIAGLSPREKAIGLAAAGILLFFVLDWIMFRPLSRHLDGLSAKIQEKESMIPKRLTVLSRKDEIEQAHQANAAWLTDAKLSREEEIAAYLGEIERVSQRVGLFISNINPVQTEEAGAAYHLKVDVEGAGSIANIKKFVSSLEEANPSARVSAVSLRGQGAGNDELRFRFTVVKLGLKTAA
jgi:type II secretory pathway component PulM